MRGDFRLKERYKKTCNLILGGRRFSLVSDYKDMGPRSLLVDFLDDVADHLLIDNESLKVPVIYDPNISRAGDVSRRWNALFDEWYMLLDDELEVLLFTLNNDGYDALVGLGPGSTPAGDDFLTGMHIGLRWMGHNFKNVISFQNLESRTTWFSSCMLYDAANGLTWYRSKKLLQALSRGADGEVEDALNELMSTGHTSGRAWISGFFHAVSVCNSSS